MLCWTDWQDKVVDVGYETIILDQLGMLMMWSSYLQVSMDFESWQRVGSSLVIEEYGVQYNPTKTVCIFYSKKDTREKTRIELYGTALQWVDMVKHLGNYLDANTKEKKSDIEKERRTYTKGEQYVSVHRQEFRCCC